MFADYFFSQGFIHDATLNKIKNPRCTTKEKALQLYTVIQNVVQDHPDKYDTFVSILRQNPLLYTDLLRTTWC